MANEKVKHILVAWDEFVNSNPLKTAIVDCGDLPDSNQESLFWVGCDDLEPTTEPKGEDLKPTETPTKGEDLKPTDTQTKDEEAGGEDKPSKPSTAKTAGKAGKAGKAKRKGPRKGGSKTKGRGKKFDDTR